MSPQNKNCSSKRKKSYSLGDKLALIVELENGKTQAQLSKEKQIPPSTIQEIWKKRESIKNHSATTNLDFKKVKKSEFPEVDAALPNWLKVQRARNLPISGPILHEKALEIARDKGYSDFSSSAGWLNHWKKRHDISFKVAAGEEAAVDLTISGDWLNKVWPAHCTGFQAKDIFNADETGLFYRLLPDKTFDFKGKNCHGGKKSKERLTVLLCANATGKEKLQPLVIGKSKKPRCFKKIKDLSALPVKYEANKKAWMTGQIFNAWLHNLNKKMRLSKRKILLVLDNCSAHVVADSNLSNVRVVFLPPNCTSRLQPMDRGVINSMKQKYRSRILKKIIARFDNGENGNIDVLEAIYGISEAWNSVTSDCVKNCFRSSGLVAGENDEVMEVTPEDNSNLISSTGVTFEDYVNVDENVVTCGEIVDDVNMEKESAEQEVESSDEDDSHERAVLPSSQALNYVNDLKHYVTCHGGSNEVLRGLEQVERFILESKEHSSQQTTLDNFLVRS